jgi:gliding motility-associated-like protein
MTNPPGVLTGSINQVEGCASIADAVGNLLFYTDGITVWNQTHSVMANGTGLFGNSSATQSALIIRKPGSTTIYYIFTEDAGNGPFCYSIVDMSLAAGMGSVTVKNTLLFSTGTEKLTSVKHCNGVDNWIIMHEAISNNFRSYLLTSAGLNTVAVVSSVGSGSLMAGYLKASSNGKKIATTISSITMSATIISPASCEIYDFDPSTGLLSNSLNLFVDSISAYGCEFSPDGTKLYVSSHLANPTSSGNTKVSQWNLCAGSATAIANSKYTVYNSTGGRRAALQLAIDGKIYIAREAEQFLSVINNPNLLGSSCNYVDQGPSIAPNGCRYGLPNLSIYTPKPSPPPLTFTANNIFGCQTIGYTMPAVQSVTNTGCSSIGYSLTGFVWDFGDSGSGPANTSTLSNPVHVYTSLGTYTPQLILYYSCGGGTDTLRQTVNVSQLCISVNSHSITCANLGSATVSVINATGPFSYTWLPTSQTGSIATNLSPGTYTLIVHDAGSNITTATTTVFTPLVPLTGNLSAVTNLNCPSANNGTATVKNLTGGSGNQSYLWTNGATSYTTAFVNTLSAGLWSVTVTDALTGCQINNTLLIFQPPSFSLSLTAGTPSACANSSIILTGTNSGGTPGYTYSWINGPQGDSFVVNEPIAGTYIFTLTSLDTNNCSISNTVSVDFVPNPTLSVSNFSICPLEIGTLTVSGANSYTWNGTLASNTFTDNPLTNQQYTVAGSALSCTSSTTASIVLKPLPNPILTSNSPRCNGDNLTLNASGGTFYLLSGPLNFTSSLQNPNINPVSVNNAGVYNVTATAVNGCTASTSQTVVVNPTPTLSATGSTVCINGTLNLLANSSASSYLWLGPQSFTSNLQNPFISTPLTNQSGTYTVNVTSILGCTNSAIVFAGVVPPPSLTVALSGNGTLCAQAFNGSPNTITLTSAGANTYTLTTPNYLYNVNPNGPISPLINQPPFQSSVAVAIATLVGSNDVCTAVTTVSFSIIPNPTLSISSPTPVICAGKNYTYTNQGATSYSWGPGTPGLSTYTGPVTVASPTVTSVYSVIGGSLGCNSGTQTSTITVYPLPTISIVPNTPTVCLNSKVNLVAVGAVSYTWMPYNGLNTQYNATVSSGPSTQQSYTITGTSVDNCTNTAMVSVSVLPLPSPVANISRSKICVNEEITLLGSGGIEYVWNGPANFYFEGQNVNFVAHNIYYGGTYTLTVSDSNGCKATSTVPVTVYSLPEGSLYGSRMQSCVPFCTDFNYYSSLSSSSLVTTSWLLDNKNFLQKSFSYCFTSPGDYLIQAQFLDTSSHCVNTKTFVVNAYPVPLADFKMEPEKPVEGLDRVSFINTSTGSNQSKWNWFFIDNQGYQSQNENTSYLFEEAGIYPVAMIVTNYWGCSDSIVKSIKIESDLAVYVPNTFSPNDDELNDIFLPVLRGIKFYDLAIYDRLGEKVFGTTDQLTGWDGTYKGEECKNDVYTWKIKLSANNGEMKTMTGFVMLSK